MLMLTQDAAQAINVLAAGPGAEGLRISSAEGATEAGTALQIGVAEAPAGGDAVLAAGDAQVFLASDTVDLLADKVLDAEVEGQDVRFTLLEQQGDQPTDPGPSNGSVI